jgi:hypothetical protein
LGRQLIERPESAHVVQSADGANRTSAAHDGCDLQPPTIQRPHDHWVPKGQGNDRDGPGESQADATEAGDGTPIHMPATRRTDRANT